MTAVNVSKIEHAQPEEPQKPEPVARAATSSKMFRYSEYLHVGEGAAECAVAKALEAGEPAPQCGDTKHFHAWCRLPNPYQHEDIRGKGLAAKARRLRELRDPESDASVILDGELAMLNDPGLTEQLVDELLARDWSSDYFEAQREVEESEDYEHIVQDREEFHRRADEADLPEDERSAEYKQLAAHMQRYVDAIKAGLEAVQEPKRAGFRERSLDDLIKLVRAQRVEEAGDRAFLDAYNPWTWFVGTFKVDLHPTLGWPHLPMWEDIGRKDTAAAGTMYGAAPEVIEALKQTFNSLQLALQRGSTGNS